MYNKISVGLSLVGLVFNSVFPMAAITQETAADSVNICPVDGLVTLSGQAVIQSTSPDTLRAVGQRTVVVTAYSSTPDQCDATPFITALGTQVRDGIIACNFLRFGTKVRFPDIYGDKVFVVEDRMALRNSHKIDIWFETREQAKQFGVKRLKVEILES